MNANAERIAALRKVVADATAEIATLETTVTKARPMVSPDGSGRKIRWITRDDAQHPALYRAAKAAAAAANEVLEIEPDPNYA